MPLRLSRTVAALIAVGATAAFLGLSAAPASADQVRQEQWWLASAGITGAWPASQGAGVTVAVLSDGVQPGEPDLRGAVTFAPALPGTPVAASPYAGAVGTALASLIAGRGHGSGSAAGVPGAAGVAGAAGVIGVAPAARILSVPVTLPGDDPLLTAPSVAGTIPAAIAAGIRYAVRHGAQVIDLPIDPGEPDSTGYGGNPAAAGGSQAEQAAVGYALQHNVVLVAPAGDNAAAADAANYPAAYHGVIAVGSIDSAFQLAAWSNQQSYVALTAPGVDMVAASSAGGYQTVSGTSAASAIVAGVAALIRSRYPALTADQVRQALMSGASRRPARQKAPGWGSGAVSAVQAMTAAARLGTPATRQADAGARPHVAPAAVAPARHGNAAGIERAGLVSGALLAVLLLLIGMRMALRRRPRPAAARWARRQAQSRYPRPPGAGSDRMPDVINSPVPGPAQAGVVPVPGRPSPTAAGATTGSPYAPASRGTGRRPAVSGAPPWEPAVAPTSELPWTASAGRHSAGGRPTQPRRSARALPAGRTRPRPDAEPAIEGPPPEAGQPGTGQPGTGRTGNLSQHQPGASLRGRGGRALAAAAVPSPSGSPDPVDPPVHRAPRPPVPLAASRPARDRPVGSTGLPMRQPGATKSAPLSPSGSLWESLDTTSGSSLWERAAPRAEESPESPAGAGHGPAGSTAPARRPDSQAGRADARGPGFRRDPGPAGESRSRQ